MKTAIYCVSGFAILASGVGVGLSQQAPALPNGAIVGVVPVGGLSVEEAQKKLRLWWESERTGTATFSVPQLTVKIPDKRWDAAGLQLDDVGSIAQIKLEGFWDNTARTVGLKRDAVRYEVLWKVDSARAKPVVDQILAAAPPIEPARVTYEKGKIVRRYEKSRMGLTVEGYSKALIAGFKAQSTVELELTEAVKTIPDAELDKIVGEVSKFTTKFPTYKVSRCQNIQLASKIIDGTVIMPGKTFNFNEVVGERTIKRGFKMAGVYVNGRHDEGVGGGICQVSTTMYNAALFGNFEIVERSCHSLPVPYVPTGRDAAVSYGTKNLIFKNTYDFPIAINSEYKPGVLTFHLLGVPQKGLEVTIERGRESSWSNGTRFEHDPSLPWGKTRVIDRGGAGRKVATTRVIKMNGKVVKREPLGLSVYSGSPTIIGKNMKAKRPAPKAAPAPAGEGPAAEPVATPEPPSTPE